MSLESPVIVSNPPCSYCESSESRRQSKAVISCVLIREGRRQKLPRKDYAMRVTNVKRKKCGIMRATFVVKMPDFINPKTEFWILTFCCDLHRFNSDMAAITSCCYPEMTEATSDAIRVGVEIILQALERDANSVPLNSDYLFFPRYSKDMMHIVGSYFKPKESGNEDVLKMTWNDSKGAENGDSVEVTIPAHATSLVCRLAKYLSQTDSIDPVIIMPSSAKNGGHLLHLRDHPSFLCSWDGIDCGFGLYFLPNYKNFIVTQGRDSIGPQMTIYYPPSSGLLALTPTTKVACVQSLAIVHPKNLSLPLIELPLPETSTDPVNCDDLVALVLSIRESLADPNAETANGDSWIVPAALIQERLSNSWEMRTSMMRNRNSRTVPWSINGNRNGRFGSINSRVSAPSISREQGALPPQVPCQQNSALAPAVESGKEKPTSQPCETPAAPIVTQDSSIPDVPAEAEVPPKQNDENVENVSPKRPLSAGSRFRIIRLPESERATNWGLYPYPKEEKEDADAASVRPSNGTPSVVPTGAQTPASESEHALRNQTQTKPTIARRQTMQCSDLAQLQRSLSPIAEVKQNGQPQAKAVRRTESERLPKPSESVEKAPYVPPGANLMAFGKPSNPVPGLYAVRRETK